ncbi:MAG: DUF433 domain-containing protein [Caldilineales bacterium]|nr:DUF433 domain-containing protein [Caldilineales bacterium]MDW8317722.1 DUF433 domain-containing protein [Anaerolineae bacterium]
MVFRYFAQSDMLYIELMPGTSIESQEVAPGVVLDFDAQDRVIGIEIEDASSVINLSELQVLSLPLASFIVVDRTPYRAQSVPSAAPALAEERATYCATDSGTAESEWQQHIVSDTEVMSGKPVIRGTRLTVEHILNLLADGLTPEEIVTKYGGVSVSDVRACLRFAARSLGATRVPA